MLESVLLMVTLYSIRCSASAWTPDAVNIQQTGAPSTTLACIDIVILAGSDHGNSLKLLYFRGI